MSDSLYLAALNIRIPLQPASSLTKIIIPTGLAVENMTALEVCSDNDGAQHTRSVF
jgi:hypothetical protein